MRNPVRADEYSTTNLTDWIMGKARKQHSPLLYNLKSSIGLEGMPTCIPFVDWWWVQAYSEPGITKGGDWKNKTEKPKRGG